MTPSLQQNLFLMTIGGVGLTSFGCASAPIHWNNTDNKPQCAWTRVNEPPTCEDVLEPQLVVLTERFQMNGRRLSLQKHVQALAFPPAGKMAVADYRLKISATAEGQDALQPVFRAGMHDGTPRRPRDSACHRESIRRASAVCRSNRRRRRKAWYVSAEIFVEDLKGSGGRSR
jgi:hypothetical protein